MEGFSQSENIAPLIVGGFGLLWTGIVVGGSYMADAFDRLDTRFRANTGSRSRIQRMSPLNIVSTDRSQ